MDSSGLVCEKFVKFVTRSDTSKNEMRIPSDFCSKYGNQLPASFHVILRNGYRLPVDFDRRRGILKGFLWFFNHFDLKGGEMLLFEYYGRYDLNVYIIGTNCSEIEYPSIVHHLQTCHPGRVTLGNGGWRFLFFVDPTVSLVDEIEPPTTFIERCGSTFPIWPRIGLNNGKVFRGTYSRQTGKISCLRTMCDVLGLADLKPFHMLLFTYDGVGMVNVSVFDENLFEVVFPGSPTSIDETSPTFDIASRFEITIQPCHMLKYCYGVDISTEYKDLCDMWARIDYINVYSGDSSWRLQVRKRSDWKRTTINDGWVEFREDLGLNVGDICSFQCCTDSYSNFTVSVIKYHLNDV
ncbi:TF-B3 domain-containing protein [Heracleum sosnowskyi]|uniref:TF-B3 domain-containing protein n=1 Tax=Heracleum sosnowskyi TaxID=360622 RepID=A0AAD8N4J5_9APIA|nr:TF-B3 domain-containing protein [Heracleum sosnowskyi]